MVYGRSFYKLPTRHHMSGSHTVSVLQRSIDELKYRIKGWEKDFHASNGYKPSKVDVEAQGLSELYVKYESLKLGLENALKASRRPNVSCRPRMPLDLLDSSRNLPLEYVSSSISQEILLKQIPGSQSYNSCSDKENTECLSNPIDLPKRFLRKRKSNSILAKSFPKKHVAQAVEIFRSEELLLSSQSCENIEAVETFKTNEINTEPCSSDTDILESKIKSTSKELRVLATRAKRPRQHLSENFVRLDLKSKCKQFVKSRVRSRSCSWMPTKTYKRMKLEHNARSMNQVLYSELLNERKEDSHLTEFTPHAASNPLKMALAGSDTKERLRETMMTFGIEKFRAGQKEAIELILSGQSCLLILPTGAGKSLCYQIPSFILPGVTLVITPLVSLIQDQITRLPNGLKGICWTSQQCFSSVQALKEALRLGTVDVLFVAPERVFTNGFKALLKELPSPGISFACIDEAHCVSQWSHNFRPCYMRLAKTLQDIGIHSVLALTATATGKTLTSICQHLNIPQDNVICRLSCRENLHVSVSREHNRKDSLVSMLKSGRIKFPAIIYCHRKKTVEEIVNLLKFHRCKAAGYHGSVENGLRSRVQQEFMENQIDIVVATKAFGMGLDKCDVRSVIHYNAPQNLEDFIQEIGRAGRDGESATCHTFFDEEDVYTYRSLIHSDGIDKHQIAAFVDSLVSNRGSNGLSLMKIENSEKRFDIRREVLETILCRMEIDKEESNCISLLPNIHASCTLTFFKKSFDQLAETNEFISSVYRIVKPRNGKVTIRLSDASEKLNCPLENIQKNLLDLQRNDSVSLEWKDLSFHVHIRADFQDPSSMIDRLYRYFCSQESTQLLRVNIIGQLLKCMASNRYEASLARADEFQECFRSITSLYFDKTSSMESILHQIEAGLAENERTDYLMDPARNGEMLSSDCRVFLIDNKDKVSTARQIARIFHGISSPKFPYLSWCKNPYWGRYIYVPFAHTLSVCEQVLSETMGRKLKKPLGTYSADEI